MFERKKLSSLPTGRLFEFQMICDSNLLIVVICNLLKPQKNCRANFSPLKGRISLFKVLIATAWDDNSSSSDLAEK